MLDNNIEPKIDSQWREVLNDEFNSEYFTQLKEFLVEEKTQNIVYPNGKYIFNAFNYCPFDQVKIVILGQDPYHSYELIDEQPLPHAHGLCFSISKEAKKIPPSLKNIFKELKEDIGLPIPQHGNLDHWAQQGILMLNATLTVRAHKAGAHQKKGWEQFTDAAIQQLSDKRKGIVFILWGKFAQNKESLIDQKKHFILKAAHPSPFSAHNGFFGCQHFSKANELLEKQGLAKIDW